MLLLNMKIIKQGIIETSQCTCPRCHAELEYSSSDHCYTLSMDSFLSNKELLSIAKVLIGSRAFNNQDFPFDKLIDLLGVKRNSNRNPLFDLV